MPILPALKSGDQVRIIAPASRSSDKQLQTLVDILTDWQLHCVVSDNIFGDDLLCANTDTARFSALQQALQDETTKAIFCVRGGYGSLRLIPYLTQLQPPKSPKLFLGMSDITALNLFFQQKWQWPVVHGALAPDIFSEESTLAMKAFLFSETNALTFPFIPLNTVAKSHNDIRANVTGGNLCLVQASMATEWQIDTKNKIVFLEEIGERAYRVDRMLEHLTQSGIFKEASAIVFGDFILGDEPNGTSKIQPVLKRFAENLSIPVVQVKGIGHDKTSFPLPLGTEATLTFGNINQLICKR